MRFRVFAFLTVASGLAVACSSNDSTTTGGGGAGTSTTTTHGHSSSTDSSTTGPGGQGGQHGEGGASSSQSTTTTTTNTSTSTSSSMGGGGASSCSGPTQLGQPVPINAVDGTAPTGQGGTVVDGTYTFTDDSAYGTGQAAGPLGFTIQGTLQITGTDYTSNVALGVSGMTSDTLEVGTLVTSGVNLTLTVSCPSGAKGMAGTYTATDTSIILYAAGMGGAIQALTLTKQP
jgi:hypothetical protein